MERGPIIWNVAPLYKIVATIKDVIVELNHI
jgi:hypothetical protein